MSPLQSQALRWAKVDLQHIERITPFCVPPWYPKADIKILDRDRAIIAAQRNAESLEFYTDGSVRNDLVGVAVWSSKGQRKLCIGTPQDLNAFYAELYAIRKVTQAAQVLIRQRAQTRTIHATVRTDSQSALKALAKPLQQSGQHIISKILEDINWLRERQTTITFCWVPAHSGIKGNEAAHSLAQMATDTSQKIDAAGHPRLRSVTLRCAKQDIPEPARSQSDLEHLSHQVDKALPGNHTRTIYDSLTKYEASFHSP